jgi:hypothetical protein
LRSLQLEPAVAAGVTDRLWDVVDLVAAREDFMGRVEKAIQDVPLNVDRFRYLFRAEKSK